MDVLVLETAPQAYHPQARELVHKQSIRIEQIYSRGIFRKSVNKNN
jgi:hypothetical protein